MKLKKYLKESDMDLFMDQVREVNSVVLGVNTFLFFENPLLEGEYYPVDSSLTEDEKEHFMLLNQLLTEAEMTKRERTQKSPLGPSHFKASKELHPDEWTQEVEKAYKDITSKARKAYHKLDDLQKKSFVVKYILHGLDVKRGKEDWGRITKDGPKRLYSDKLKSYKEQQRFTKDVLAMIKAQEIEAKEGERHLNKLMSRFKSLVDLEASLGRSTDGNTTKLANWAKDKFGKGWFPEEAYLEYMFKIQAKQYNNLKELTDCAKQWSAIEGNTKTVKSLDITTVCPKREKLLEMLQEWGKANQDITDAIENGSDDATIARLQARADKLKVTDANNPTCAYCYVETGRERQALNPNYIFGKEEKRGQRYQDTFKGWIKYNKDGTPQTDSDGNYLLNKTGQQNVAKFNKMGGLRFFSSGDYIENEATDKEIEKIIADAQDVGLQLKAITKQPQFVTKYGSRKFISGPLKGRPVFNINMSVDEQLGFPLKTAIAIKKQYPGNVNVRVVARNPKEAAAYARNSEVDVITLLHFGQQRPRRMSNKELYQDMSGPKSPGWKAAMDLIKKENPKENWNKIFTKICCNMDGEGKCTKCPNACGFNPRRVADFVQLAKGGKMKIKAKDVA